MYLFIFCDQRTNQMYSWTTLTILVISENIITNKTVKHNMSLIKLGAFWSFYFEINVLNRKSLYRHFIINVKYSLIHRYTIIYCHCKLQYRSKAFLDCTVTCHLMQPKGISLIIERKRLIGQFYLVLWYCGWHFRAKTKTWNRYCQLFRFFVQWQVYFKIEYNYSNC